MALTTVLQNRPPQAAPVAVDIASSFHRHRWLRDVGINRELIGSGIVKVPAQAKFFLLADDIADIYFMGMDQSFIGRHHVRQSFPHTHREDQLASTAIPSLGGYGVAELEPFESQERGFQHGHRKKYAIPKNKERELTEQFKSHNQTELHGLFQDLKVALIRCAETLQ